MQWGVVLLSGDNERHTSIPLHDGDVGIDVIAGMAAQFAAGGSVVLRSQRTTTTTGAVTELAAQDFLHLVWCGCG